MTRQSDKTIRMGGAAPGGNRRYLLAGGIGVLVVLAAVVVIVVLSSGEEAPEKKRGCENDEACGPGKVCLNRGCVMLLASEHRDLWHHEVNAQLDAGDKWEARKTVGEKLSPLTPCPAKKGEVPPPRLDKIVVSTKVHLFEVGPSAVSHYQFLKVKVSVWIDALRIYFPTKKKIEPHQVCASADVTEVAPGVDGKKRAFVDASLRKAAPANVDARAAVAVKRAPPPPDKEGKRELTFTLEPVIGDKKEYHTVLALPLGSDVLSINGPPPTEQRLQKGFITYYWTHKADLKEITVGYKVHQKSPYPLNIENIAP